MRGRLTLFVFEVNDGPIAAVIVVHVINVATPRPPFVLEVECQCFLCGLIRQSSHFDGTADRAAPHSGMEAFEAFTIVVHFINYVIKICGSNERSAGSLV